MVVRVTRELSPRQRQLVTLLAAGCTVEDAAALLAIAPATARTHLRRAYIVLRVHTAAAAVAESIRQGVIA